MEKLHGKYVLALADKAPNNVIIIWKQMRSTEGCSKLKSPENKTSPGEIGLDIRTHASLKVW